MITLGCFAGLWLARKEAERNGISRENIGFFFYMPSWGPSSVHGYIMLLLPIWHSFVKILFDKVQEYSGQGPIVQRV